MVTINIKYIYHVIDYEKEKIFMAILINDEIKTFEKNLRDSEVV